MYNLFLYDRGVAQVVARGAWDAEVGGSNPLAPTIIKLYLMDIIRSFDLNLVY